MAYKTRLGGSKATFDGMMKNGFGIVTVMNARVFDALDTETLKGKNAYQIYNDYKANTDKLICTIDTLKIANVTQEGPTKTVTGGQYSNPLIKFGKSARLEIQDALGRAQAIDALCGGVAEYVKENDTITGLHFGEDFVGAKMIIGDSFFIDRTTGEQVKVAIIFYQFLPDSIFNLTQDAEGDATVFDMNGDLLTTEILVGNEDGTRNIVHGVFYSIIDPEVKEATFFTTNTAEDGKMTLTANPGYTITVDGSSNPLEIPKNQAARVVVTKTEGNVVVYDQVIKNY